MYKRYYDRLNGINGIKLCAIKDNVEPNYSYFPVVFDTKKEKSRDESFESLANKTFMPGRVFILLLTIRSATKHMMETKHQLRIVYQKNSYSSNMRKTDSG